MSNPKIQNSLSGCEKLPYAYERQACQSVVRACEAAANAPGTQTYVLMPADGKSKHIFGSLDSCLMVSKGAAMIFGGGVRVAPSKEPLPKPVPAKPAPAPAPAQPAPARAQPRPQLSPQPAPKAQVGAKTADVGKAEIESVYVNIWDEVIAIEVDPGAFKGNVFVVIDKESRARAAETYMKTGVLPAKVFDKDGVLLGVLSAEGTRNLNNNTNIDEAKFERELAKFKAGQKSEIKVNLGYMAAQEASLMKLPVFMTGAWEFLKNDPEGVDFAMEFDGIKFYLPDVFDAVDLNLSGAELNNALDEVMDELRMQMQGK